MSDAAVTLFLTKYWLECAYEKCDEPMAQSMERQLRRVAGALIAGVSA